MPQSNGLEQRIQTDEQPDLAPQVPADLTPEQGIALWVEVMNASEQFCWPACGARSARTATCKRPIAAGTNSRWRSMTGCSSGWRSGCRGRPAQVAELVAGRILDRADVAALPRANQGTVDVGHLRQAAADRGVREDLEEIWAEAFPGARVPEGDLD